MDQCTLRWAAQKRLTQRQQRFKLSRKGENMGSLHKASCSCGFETEVDVGGSRSSFTTNSTFPFHCNKCGIVDINIRLDKICCPKCFSEHIHQYGKEIASDLTVIQSHPYARLQNFNYQAYQDGNLCPKCKKYNLVFHPARLRYD
jgi:hypothetical protein